MRRVLPPLRYTHPGYFLIAMQVLLTHAGLGIDAFVNHHSQPQWQYVNAIIGFDGWAIIHAVILAVGIIGLYTNLITVLRLAWSLSVAAFWVLGVQLIAGVYVANGSYAIAILLLGSSISSIAAYHENPVNPAMQKP